MPKLSKIQKKVGKKGRDTKTLNENSRDARKLRRAGAKDELLDRRAHQRAKRNNPHVQRVAFLKDVAKRLGGPFAVETVNKFVQEYIGRGDEELNELKASRRKGRPTSSRQDLLEQRKIVEENEYATGFWIPDMQNEKNLQQLLLWNGEWASVNNIKFVRLSRDGTTKQSSFPPNGQS